MSQGHLPGGMDVHEPSPKWRWGSFTGSILIDSGPLLALFNRADKWHAPVMSWLELNQQAELVTTWPVLTEVCAMLARRVHHDAALDALRWVQRGGVTVDAPHGEQIRDSLAHVLEISLRFASLPFDLADASIAEAASRLQLRDILSIDSDFDVYRDRVGGSLNNRLRPS